MTATPAKLPSASVIRRLTGTLTFSSEAVRYGRPTRRLLDRRTALLDEIVAACPTVGGLLLRQSGDETTICVQYVDEIDIGVALCALEQLGVARLRTGQPSIDAG